MKTVEFLLDFLKGGRNINTFLFYTYRKLVASGFALFTFTFIIFLFNQFKLYDLSELLASYWLWIAFYPYAIISSVIIDRIHSAALARGWANRYLLFILYVLFGFLPFILMMFPEIPYIIIAGVVGAFAASLFLIGLTFVNRNKWASLTFAFFIPALFVFIMLHDFTKKENWRVTETATSYEASYTYFNGKHKIPIELQKDDTVTFQIEFGSQNDGGWGNYVEDPQKDHIGMETIDDEDDPYDDPNNPEKLRFKATEAGTYYIVVTGDKQRGNFLVEWSILDS